MKNDDQRAEALLRQMGRLVVPLVTPEREASRHERMASAVNRLLQRCFIGSSAIVVEGMLVEREASPPENPSEPLTEGSTTLTTSLGANS